MPRIEVRLAGDPFARSDASVALRRVLRLALARRFVVSVSLSAARGEEAGRGRSVSLTDGAGASTVWTEVQEPELTLVLDAARTAVAATAPLVAFGDADLQEQAALEWSLATCRVDGGGADAAEVLAAVERGGAAAPARRTGWDDDELAELLALEPGSRGNTLLHFGSGDPSYGTEVLVASFARSGAVEADLRIVLPERDGALEARLLALAAAEAPRGREPRIAFCRGRIGADAVRDVAAIVFPCRELKEPLPLVKALAAARPVVASRFAGTARVLGAHGLVWPVGGRPRPDGARTTFEPDARSLAHALERAVADRRAGVEMAIRARRHVVTHLRRGVPETTRPTAGGGRPVVVLEAPLLSRGSAGILTCATARALARRGRVELRLVPTLPHAGSLAAFRAEQPALAARLTGNPPPADLWLASGWPPRQTRPEAGTFAVRLDWEYGALPTDLMPLLSDEADRVIVHSTAVRQALAAAGRPVESIDLIEHGVDGELFHEDGATLEEVVRWKRGRKALLFVGGLVWRKGIDVLLKVLAERHRGDGSICLVVKSIGGGSSYRGYELGDLVARYAALPGAVETLLLERDMSPAEIASLYRSCDLLVHPYRGEGFALPVVEARACGLPVLVTAGGATDDQRLAGDDPSFVTIASEHRALELPMPCEGQPWVREPDPDALATLLAGVPELLPGLQAAARATAARVRARWSWDRAAERLEALAFAAMGLRAGR